MAMDWNNVVLTGLYYLLYPVYWLLSWLFYILYCIVSPFLYIGYLLKEATLMPFRFLAKFEALWYFLLCAILIGVVAALICHFILRGFVSVFDLDRKPVPKPVPPKGHSAASYRAARQAKKQQELEAEQAKARKARLYAALPIIRPPPPASGDSRVSPGTKRTSLAAVTILEHTDEEDDDSVF